LVVKIPIKSFNKLSKKLEKTDMLIPIEIILDNLLEDQAEISIHAIHMHSGFKADLKEPNLTMQGGRHLGAA
jgi:hypothetical protein